VTIEQKSPYKSFLYSWEIEREYNNLKSDYNKAKKLPPKQKHKILRTLGFKVAHLAKLDWAPENISRHKLYLKIAQESRNRDNIRMVRTHLLAEKDYQSLIDYASIPKVTSKGPVTWINIKDILIIRDKEKSFGVNRENLGEILKMMNNCELFAIKTKFNNEFSISLSTIEYSYPAMIMFPKNEILNISSMGCVNVVSGTIICSDETSSNNRAEYEVDKGLYNIIVYFIDSARLEFFGFVIVLSKWTKSCEKPKLFEIDNLGQLSKEKLIQIMNQP